MNKVPKPNSSDNPRILQYPLHFIWKREQANVQSPKCSDHSRIPVFEEILLDRLNFSFYAKIIFLKILIKC